MDYFYDGQIRRYLVQFMRIFSDFKIKIGPDSNGVFSLSRVPVIYGDPSTLVAQIIKGNSENTLMPSPLMSVWIDSIKTRPQDRRDTQFVSKLSTTEREFNNQTKTYGSGPGVRYDIERYMPVPYTITFRLDIWTTNVINKLELFEQIGAIFNPSIQLQQNDNLLDWTSIFEVWLKDDPVWTNRNIQQQTGDERDILTLRFDVPVWLNPPAKVKRSKIISEIVTRVFSDEDINNIDSIVAGGNTYDPFSELSVSTQIITTYSNYKISVQRGTNSDEITLLNEFGVADPSLSWQDLVNKFGKIEPNITTIRLKLDPNIDVSTSDIIGYISQDPNRKNILIFTPDTDTLPVNTILPIAGIIDPTEVFPGHGLPAAGAGQRYLLTSDNSNDEYYAIPIGVNNSPWGSNLVAYPNDIIEYNGVAWNVIFNSKSATGKNYVINNSNVTQYTFENGVWTYTYFGKYAQGYWRIDNIIQDCCGNKIDDYQL